jgi:hypothetical protein
MDGLFSIPWTAGAELLHDAAQAIYGFVIWHCVDEQLFDCVLD